MVNYTSYSFRLHWLNYSGDRVFYETVQAGETLRRQTYLTHPWVLADEGSDRCRLLISAPHDGDVYAIR